MPAARRYTLAKTRGLTAAERAATGKQARATVPRSSHAQFVAPADRPDPVALLAQQGEPRVPSLLPIRYGRMLASAFAFYRGAALVMAADLSRTPASGLAVQACGDAHLSNFGAFGTPERHLAFDINDFDETNPGPWEWDVKRLAASLEVAGRDNGFSAAESRGVVLAGVTSYREAMATFAVQQEMDVWYAMLSAEKVLDKLRAAREAKLAKRVTKEVDKAHTRDSMQAFEKLTEVVDGQRRIKADPPLVVPLADLAAENDSEVELGPFMTKLLDAYRRTLISDRRQLLGQFEFVDMARKVVGVGSVGTRCWIVLLTGRDQDDPLFLQVKEAGPSVLEGFTGKSLFASSGERVVAGQRLMQSASDIFLGWEKVTGFDGVDRSFYVRQLRDWKTSSDITAFAPPGLGLYAQMCGWTLAKAHARSGDRIAIAAYLGSGTQFDTAVADFAVAYADQNEKDYQSLQAAVADGRITATTGV